MSSTSPMTLTPIASIRATCDAGQPQHDVDVVDHHVQHDADVDAAERQRADARDLDEPRPDVQPLHRADRGVEPLDVPDLHGRAVLSRAHRRSRRASATSLASGFSIRHGHAAPQERLGHVRRDVASAPRSSPPPPAAAAPPDPRKRPAAELRDAVFGGRVGVGVIHAHQPHLRHLRIDARVQPPHPPAADDARRGSGTSPEDGDVENDDEESAFDTRRMVAGTPGHGIGACFGIRARASDFPQSGAISPASGSLPRAPTGRPAV